MASTLGTKSQIKWGPPSNVVKTFDIATDGNTNPVGISINVATGLVSKDDYAVYGPSVNVDGSHFIAFVKASPTTGEWAICKSTSQSPSFSAGSTIAGFTVDTLVGDLPGGPSATLGVGTLDKFNVLNPFSVNIPNLLPQSNASEYSSYYAAEIYYAESALDSAIQDPGISAVYTAGIKSALSLAQKGTTLNTITTKNTVKSISKMFSQNI